MTFDLEKRAHELFPGPAGGRMHFAADTVRDLAFQLAREAADARAEDIARTCERAGKDHGAGSMGAYDDAAYLARSTIRSAGLRPNVRNLREELTRAQREGRCARVEPWELAWLLLEASP